MFDRFKNIFGREETEQNVEQAEEVVGVVEETQGTKEEFFSLYLNILAEEKNRSNGFFGVSLAGWVLQKPFFQERIINGLLNSSSEEKGFVGSMFQKAFDGAKKSVFSSIFTPIEKILGKDVVEEIKKEGERINNLEDEAIKNEIAIYSEKLDNLKNGIEASQDQADAGSTTPDSQGENSTPTEGGAEPGSTNSDPQSSTA